MTRSFRAGVVPQGCALKLTLGLRPDVSPSLRQEAEGDQQLQPHHFSEAPFEGPQPTSS